MILLYRLRRRYMSCWTH